MARMPGARWVGPNHDNGVMSQYDIFCLHTIVGYAPAHPAHWSVHANGDIDQSRDTRYRSAANLNGNHRVLAVETEDHGPEFAGYWKHGSDVPPWTPEQIESLAEIAVFVHREHGIPLVACPNSKPGSRGIAYHRQGIDGNFSNGRVEGGEVWSSSRGKVCPGDRRIAQIPRVIKRARQLAGLEEDDMQPTDPVKDPGGGKWGHVWLNAQQNSTAIRQMVDTIEPQLAAIRAAIAADRDISADDLATLIDQAVDRHTPTVEQTVAALIPVLKPALLEVIGGDNAEQADAIVDALVARLNNGGN